MLTTFVPQKAGLSSIPFFVAMPMGSRLKMAGPATGQKSLPAISKGEGQRPELVSLDPKHTERKSKDPKLILSVIGLMNCFLLSGCTGSTYSGHFDCPMGEGAGCASISRVNKMIDRREIDLGNDDAPLAKGNSAPQTLGRQAYVYYGPNQLSRLISIDGQEGN